MLPKGKESRYPPCSHDSAYQWSWASISSSEGSPVRSGSPVSSKVSRSGNGCGLARPSPMQVQRTCPSRLIDLIPRVQQSVPRPKPCERNPALSELQWIARATHLPHPVRIHQNLAGFPSLQAFHPLREIFHRDAIRNDGVQVQFAGFEERSHLIPRLVHATAVDPLNREAFENYVFREVQRDRLGGQTQQGDASAAADNVESRSDGVRVAS